MVLCKRALLIFYMLTLLGILLDCSTAFTATSNFVVRTPSRRASHMTTKMSNQDGNNNAKDTREESQSGAGAINRRIFGAGAASSFLSLLFGMNAAEASELPVPKVIDNPKTIVLTGASSGLGKEAAKMLVAAGHNVYVSARTMGKAQETLAATGAQGAYECDLSSLDSVRSFVKAWGSEPIDALCLNAGVAPATKGTAGRTKEGFELAIGTNHLGHFLLADGLFKCLESSSLAAPRLVVTASSVHDPDTPGGDVGSKATLGDLQGLEEYKAKGVFDMVDGGEYDGDKAYKDSKLCNVFFTREANRRLRAKGSKVLVNCFSPGLITSTGLFRNQSPFFVKAFDFAATNVLKVAATPEQGGAALVFMVEDEGGAGDGQFYATEPGKPKSSFGPRSPSKEAQDESKGKRLWKLSESLVGLGSGSAI